MCVAIGWFYSDLLTLVTGAGAETPPETRNRRKFLLLDSSKVTFLSSSLKYMVSVISVKFLWTQSWFFCNQTHQNTASLPKVWEQRNEQKNPSQQKTRVLQRRSRESLSAWLEKDPTSTHILITSPDASSMALILPTVSSQRPFQWPWHKHHQ